MKKSDDRFVSSADLNSDAVGSQSTHPKIEIDTVDLMCGQREIIILHAGERYCLRITANDKLILTK
ncbi:hemin uptake protein HemP [Methylobacterium sp. NMS14P]|uniref:hemin uptake protein HemP n=1 Tax=Methylobacterium sp. NMS14P TaxID=2894310 RepID=UPI0030767D05